jgi:serine/threonine protein kinase
VCARVCVCICGARAGGKILSHQVMASWYKPPELLNPRRRNTSYDLPADMWCVGCMLVEMFFGKVLFFCNDDADQVRVQLSVLEGSCVCLRAYVHVRAIVCLCLQCVCVSVRVSSMWCVYACAFACACSCAKTSRLAATRAVSDCAMEQPRPNASSPADCSDCAYAWGALCVCLCVCVSVCVCVCPWSSADAARSSRSSKTSSKRRCVWTQRGTPPHARWASEAAGVRVCVCACVCVHV